MALVLQGQEPNTGRKRTIPPKHQPASRAHISRPVILRWQVIEAPDPSPPGRTFANRPRRGRPRKYPSTDQEKEKERDEEVSIIPWKTPMPVYEDLPPGGQLIPWSRQWPEIIQFYMANDTSLDPTGRNLYSPAYYKSTTGSFMAAFQTSPGTLTLRILFAETSRPDRRASLERMLWLKGQALQLVNEGLRDPVRKVSPSALSDIVTLHNYEQIWGDRATARLHRKGLLQLITLMGGIAKLPAEARTLVPMILWSDRSRQARRLWDPNEEPPEYPLDFEPGLQPLHPLNLALLPPDRLSTPLERSHSLGISILSPGVRLMVVLDGLKRLSAAATQCAQLGHPPQMAITLREKLVQAEMALIAMQKKGEESAFFTSTKYATQQLVFEASRLAGLVVVACVKSTFPSSDKDAEEAGLQLQKSLARAAAVDVVPLLPYHLRILLFLLFVSGPLQSCTARSRYAQLAGRVCNQLRLESWEMVREVLQKVYYYPEFQDRAGERFWREVVATNDSDDRPVSEAAHQAKEVSPDASWNRYYRQST